MAKRRGIFSKPKPAAYGARRAMTASATRLDLSDRTTMQEIANQAVRMAWQEDAWRHFDRIGEIKYSYGTVASLLSKLRIYPAVVTDLDSPPVKLTDGVTIERPESESDDDSAVQKPNNGLSPQRGQELRQVYNEAFHNVNLTTMLRAYALNMDVPGECYLGKIDDRWQIKSTSELRVDGSGNPKLQRSISALPRELPSDTLIGRIWRDHPRFSFEPDSAMRALADECDELLLLSRVIRSNSRARLNAGILFVSDEVTVGSQTLTDDEETQEEEEMSLEQTLYEVFTGPVTNEDNPNTVVPAILRGPVGEGVSKHIEHIVMERKTDEFMVDRAEKVLNRILQGIDAIKETSTGVGHAKYANAHAIDENQYKIHIEPLAMAFCDAVVDIIIRPALKDLQWPAEELAKATIWYDPSEIVTRPDRATDAEALYDRKELSGAGLRSAFGFSEQEAPSEEELATRLAMGSIIPPDVVSVLLAKAFPTVLGKHLTPGQSAPGELPTSLQDTLNGTETPGAPDPGSLGDSVPGDLTTGGTPVATDSSAPAADFGASTADVAAPA